MSEPAFENGEDGLSYKTVNGFLYTLADNKKEKRLSVNLPAPDKSERTSIRSFCSIESLRRVTFSKDGAHLHLPLETGEEAVLSLAERLAAFLKNEGIGFSNTSLNIVRKKKMYVFAPVAREAAAPDEAEPEPQTGFLAKWAVSDWSVPLLLAGLTAVSILLSLLLLPAGALVGYLTGWLCTVLLLARRWKHKSIYGFVLLASFLSLLTSCGFSVLLRFLIQSKYYNFSVFILSSGFWQDCLFNLGLGLLLTLYGIYSTLPAARRTKKESEEDF